LQAEIFAAEIVGSDGDDVRAGALELPQAVMTSLRVRIGALELAGYLNFRREGSTNQRQLKSPERQSEYTLLR